MFHRNQRFLTHGPTLDSMESWARGGGLTLEIGPGRGALFRRIPPPRVGIELDPRFRPDLRGQWVIWQDFLTHNPQFTPRRILGNLPFAHTLGFLIKAHKSYPQTPQGLYIVQRELGQRMVSPSRVGVLIRWLYRPRWIHRIPGQGFHPRVRVEGALIQLQRIARPPAQVDRLGVLLRRIVNPRKVLGAYYPLGPTLARKRVDQLTAQEESRFVREILELDQPPVSGSDEIRVDPGFESIAQP